jgi:hypothetical protein
MKSPSLRTKAWGIGLIILLLLFAVSCNGRNNSSKPEIMSKETANYEVPKEKMQLWESLKNTAMKDYDVCQEHCGYEQDCLDKCEKAYKARLDREYKNLSGQ